MISDKELQIRESLANEEYRELLAIEHVNTALAIQIRKLRECRNWTQAELASRLGKHQETISQWENPDYGRYTTKTLQEIGKAFDVVLMQKFVSFGELISDMMNLSPARLCPPNYGQDSVSWNSQVRPSGFGVPSTANIKVANQSFSVGFSTGFAPYSTNNPILDSGHVFIYTMGGEEQRKPSATKQEEQHAVAA